MIDGFREPPGKIISTYRRCYGQSFCNFHVMYTGMVVCGGCNEELPFSAFRFVDWYVIQRDRDFTKE